MSLFIDIFWYTTMVFGVGHFAMPSITRFVVKWRWPHAICVTYYGTMRYVPTELENIKSFVFNAEVSPGRRLTDEIEGWLRQNSISYQFVPVAVSPFDRPMAGTVRFRTANDLVHFKLRFSDLSVVDDA